MGWQRYSLQQWEEGCYENKKKKRYMFWLQNDWDGESRGYQTPFPQHYRWEQRSAQPNLQFWTTTSGLGDRFPPDCSRFLWRREHLSFADSGGDNAKRRLGSDVRSRLACLCCLAQAKHRPRGANEKQRVIELKHHECPYKPQGPRLLFQPNKSSSWGCVWAPEFISG